jgi:transcriptional regulator with GAF, ATPase, and Fis domain
MTKATPAAEIEQLIDRWIEGGEPIGPENLQTLAGKLAALFHVDSDEVAILALISSGKVLQFLVPEKLKAIGFIPLTSTSALAAKTARERRAEVQNNFSTSRHASVFEAVPLGRRGDENIHKIMSVPILADTKAVGVVQISRKGRTAKDAGPDFNSDELRKLQAVANTLARVVQLTQKA